jgi:hypothetical protein
MYASNIRIKDGKMCSFEEDHFYTTTLTYLKQEIQMVHADLLALSNKSQTVFLFLRVQFFQILKNN